MAAGEALEHLFRRPPRVPAPRHRMLFGAGEARRPPDALRGAEDHRIHQQQFGEPLWMFARGLDDRMASHRVADADGAAQVQRLGERRHVRAEPLPTERPLLGGGAVAAQIHRDQPRRAAERPAHRVPAAGVKAGGVGKQHRNAGRVTPFPIGEIPGASGARRVLHHPQDDRIGGKRR